MIINWYKLSSYFQRERTRLAEAFFYLFSQNSVRIYLFFIIFFNLINWLLAYYVNKNVSQNLVVLHYNVNLGVNLVGDVANIYIIPAVSLIFFIVNFILLLNIFRKSKIFIHLLLGFSLPTSLFLIASTISIYLINFR